MSDEEESGKTPEPVSETLPGESFHARVKRLSQKPRKEGEPRFVRGSNLGPITFTPVSTDPDEDGAESDAEHTVKAKSERLSKFWTILECVRIGKQRGHNPPTRVGGFDGPWLLKGDRSRERIKQSKSCEPQTSVGLHRATDFPLTVKVRLPPPGIAEVLLTAPVRGVTHILSNRRLPVGVATELTHLPGHEFRRLFGFR